MSADNEFLSDVVATKPCRKCLTKINASASRCPQCRATQRPLYRRKSAIIAAAIVLLGGIGVAAAAHNSGGGNNAALIPSPTPAYQYSDLGPRCNAAIVANNKVMDELNFGLKALIAAGKSVPTTSAASAQDIAVRDQNLAQYQQAIAAGNQPLADQLFDVAMKANSAAVAADSQNLSIQEKNTQTLIDGLKEFGTRITKVRDRGARLASCVESVNRHQNFTATDLANINADIAASSSS